MFGHERWSARSVVGQLGWLLTIVWAMSGLVAGHWDGAPPNTCDTMTPHHNSSVAQTGPPPFTLSVSEGVVDGGNSLTVTLSAEEGSSFCGYLVKAVPADTRNGSLGYFNVTDVSTYKRVECDDSQYAREAATQTNATIRSSVDFTWVAPSFYYGDVFIVATVVSEYYVFWTNVNTSVFVNGTSTTPGPPTTTLPPPYQYSDCGVTRGCLGIPDNCVAVQDCSVLLKYSVSQSAGMFDFELWSKSDGYVAMGFSDDKSMGGDAVVQCLVDNSVVRGFCSYNDGHDNEILTELSTVNSSYEGGIISCEFLLPAVIEIEPLNMTFDLVNQLYYLMLVKGPVRNAEQGEVYKHDDYVISNNKVNVSDVSTPTPPPTPPFDYSNCGVTCGCFGYPDGCVSSADCSMLLQYSLSTSENDQFDFTMQAQYDGYVAMGFSDDTGMGADAVVQCIVDGSSVKAFSSYNIDDPFGNTVIGPLSATQYHSGSYVGGIISCSFSQPSTIDVEAIQKTFDLKDQNYYLLLAEGPIDDVSTGSILRHDYKVISTNKVNISDVNVSDVSTPTLPPPPPFDYSYCGVTCGCFGYPDGCVSSADCSMLLQYSLSTSENDQFDFTMQAQYDGYVAMGFSDDTGMGADAVVQCIVDGSSVKAFSSYNIDDPFGNTVIGPLSATQYHSGSYVGGIISCSFSQPSTIDVEAIQKTFYLKDQSYYLMLADGPIEDVSTGSILHHDSKVVSYTKVNMSDIAIVGGEDIDVKILIHGSFMVVAWIGTVAIAIFLARYYKDMWPDKLHLTTKIWFTYHRCLNTLTVLFAIVAFVLIFVYVGGFSEVWQTNPHPILGTIAFALMIIQPIGAVFRPGPGTPHRPWFNWCHYLVGMLSWAFALMTIFYAVSLPSSGLPEYTTWIVVSYLAFCIISFSVMEYSGQLCAAKKSESVELRELGDNNNKVIEEQKGLQTIQLKKIMLCVFVTGVIGFTVALIVIIVI